LDLLEGFQMKRNIVSTSVVVAVFSITTLGVVAAQSSYPQADKQKPAAQADKEKPAAAKPHTMTGCLEKGSDATMFRLTNVEGTGPKTVELHADASLKLAAHVGHKIAVTGPDVDPTTVKKGTAGKPEPGAGASPGATEHHMRVNSMKMISETCK
jgi:hypothetical protein